MTRARPRSAARVANDPRQYDELRDTWWDPRGGLAMLAWLAASRGELVPPARRGDAVLVDLGCGGGLLAPHLSGKGYRHVGVDIGEQAVRVARDHGVRALRGDVLALPVRNAIADVVVAGEILEHVGDPLGLVAEICRVLRPGGTVVIDTIARTRLARVMAVTVAERLPGGPPHGIHDPSLFVDRAALVAAFARHGVTLVIGGLFPHPWDYLAWLRGRRGAVRMLRVPTTGVLFSGTGRKGTARS